MFKRWGNGELEVKWDLRNLYLNSAFKSEEIFNWLEDGRLIEGESNELSWIELNYRWKVRLKVELKVRWCEFYNSYKLLTRYDIKSIITFMYMTANHYLSLYISKVSFSILSCIYIYISIVATHFFRSK